MKRTFSPLLVLALLLWGCGKDPINVQENVPKDYEGHHLHWTLPAGWSEADTTSDMQLAAFAIDAGGESYKFTITTFLGAGGSDLDNFNRWLRQLGRPAKDATGLANQRRNLFFGTHPFAYFDLTDAEAPGGKGFLAAILRENNRSWFFKLEGEGPGVAKQTPAFQQFLGSVRLQGETDELTVPGTPHAASASGGVQIARKGDIPEGAPPPPSGPPPLPPGGLPPPPPLPPEVLERMKKTPPPAIPDQLQGQLGSAKTPAWEVPGAWKPLPVTPMRRGNFSIAGEDGQAAEVTVIRLPANAGSLDANITRWGRQIGLSQEDLDKNQTPVQQLEVGGSKATYVVLRGPERSTAVATVLHAGGTWFFKFSGHNSVVESQRAAFEGFLASVKF